MQNKHRNTNDEFASLSQPKMKAYWYTNEVFVFNKRLDHDRTQALYIW